MGTFVGAILSANMGTFLCSPSGHGGNGGKIAKVGVLERFLMFMWLRCPIRADEGTLQTLFKLLLSIVKPTTPAAESRAKT